MIPISDWNIKKCLTLVAIASLVFLGLVGAAVLGLDVPVLRQVVGFLVLTIIPGTLILRILRIHNISLIESVAYSVGLSLAFVMFGGALINLVLPFMGVSQPISLLPVTAILTLLIVIMMAVAYVRDRDFFGSNRTTPVAKLQLPSVLFLVLLLAITVLSVALIDSFQNNRLLLIVILAVAAVVGVAAFGKFIQLQAYPLAIFVIGLCLLYQTTLMSPYPVGSDIYTEYHFYDSVASNGIWQASIAYPVNSCLSVVMLAPIYSVALNISGIWMFKAIYPLIFALVPLVLYQVFSHQMSQKKAFLSAFFFVAVPTFSLEMIGLCRQQVAELFLVLLILLLVDRKLKLGPRLALAAIFAISVIVSHYSLGFIGFIYLGLLVPLVVMLRSDIFRKAWGWLTTKFGGLQERLLSGGSLPIKMLLIVVIIYFVFGVAWYGIVASGVNLNVLRGLTGIYSGHYRYLDWSTSA